MGPRTSCKELRVVAHGKFPKMVGYMVMCTVLASARTEVGA